MKLRALCIALWMASALVGPARAATEVEALTRCVTDSTTGKDRKDLIRWLFVSMSAHPELRSISTIAPTALEDASKASAAVFTRLLAEACRTETQAAMKAGGSLAIQAAFQSLGQLAMMELMADRDVAVAMSQLEKHLDANKLSALRP